MKRILICTLITLLVVSVAMVGCSKPAPSPTPTPTVKPAPASPKPTASASPAAKPAPASPKPTAAAKPPATTKQQVQISILGSTLGTNTYVLTYGLSDVVNKNSTWLRASPVESTGYIENVRTLAEETAKRKTVAIASDVSINYQAEKGESPFKGPYTSLKLVAKLANSVQTLGSKDPNIRTGADLAGKKVAFGTPSALYYQHQSLIMKYGWENLDKIKVVALQFGPGKDALLDGTVDVTAIGGNEMEAGESANKPKAVAPNPASAELVDRAKLYVVDIDKASVDKAIKGSGGYPLTWVEIPAGTFGPNQPKPVGGYLLRMCWSVDSSMDDSVVYELTRIIHENAGKFGDYHASGKGLTPATIAMVPGTTEKDFHPAAVKYYKEKGIKIGG